MCCLCYVISLHFYRDMLFNNLLFASFWGFMWFYKISKSCMNNFVNKFSHETVSVGVTISELTWRSPAVRRWMIINTSYQLKYLGKYLWRVVAWPYEDVSLYKCTHLYPTPLDIRIYFTISYAAHNEKISEN